MVRPSDIAIGRRMALRDREAIATLQDLAEKRLLHSVLLVVGLACACATRNFAFSAVPE